MVKQISTVKAETRIAAYCGGDYFYRMVLLDKDYIKNDVYPDMSKEYCNLDIVALNKLIIDDVFHIDDKSMRIMYIRQEVMNRVTKIFKTESTI